MKKRSNIDFSKHELFIKTNSKLTIHDLKLEDAHNLRVIFINIIIDDDYSGLYVDGDFGRWSFSRNFVPCACHAGVDDNYWCEKIRVGSTQNPYIFDAEETNKEIQGNIKELTFDGKEDSHEKQEKLEYYINLDADVGEEEYKFEAYHKRPYSIDCEDVPYCQKTNPSLEAVFDAFEEICRRLKDQESKEEENEKN